VAHGALGTWNADGVIVFGVFGSPLQRVSEAGGKPAVVREIDRLGGETEAIFPVFLPDGRNFTYWSMRQHEKVFRCLASLNSSQTYLKFSDYPN
jgi:hypothetical protein